MRTGVFCIVSLLATWIVTGCEPKSEAPKGESVTQTSADPSQANVSSSSGQTNPGIAPVGSGMAGGVTPVTGAENVQGGGGFGAGAAAKGMANRAAGQAQGGSLNQLDAGE
jgi:hypothetical protein